MSKYMNKAARKALLARFPPDGYAIVGSMDQTIGFWDGEDFTIRHPEAVLFKEKEDAQRQRDLLGAEWGERLRKQADTHADPGSRQWAVQQWKRRVFDTWPQVDPVHVERHFRDRPDTW